MTESPKVTPFPRKIVGGGTLPRVSGLPGKDVITLVPGLSAEEEAQALWASGEWQPIETAPKDGTPILGFDPEAHSRYGDDYDEEPVPAPLIVLQWKDQGWVEPHYDVFFYHPTKWMPLPEPPK